MVDARTFRAVLNCLHGLTMLDVCRTLGVLMLGNAFWWYWMYGMFEATLTVSPNWAALMYAYLCVAFGVRYFCKRKNRREAAIRGAVLGVVVHGAHHALNMATVEGWSWQLMAVQHLWGSFVTMVAAGTAATEE